MHSQAPAGNGRFAALRIVGFGAAVGGMLWGMPTHSQNAPAPLAAISFDRDLQGFQAVAISAAGLQPDEKATLGISKDTVKEGAGALSYSYRAEPETARALLGEIRIPPGTRSLRFWARSNTATSFLLHVREEDGSAYATQFFVPEQTWTPIHLNLDDLTLSGDSEDENNQLDAPEVRNLALMDLAVLVATLSGGKPPLAIDTQRSRQLWIDEMQFRSEGAVAAGGVQQREGRSYHVVDDFENGIIRWLPVRAVLNPAEPRFELFPSRGSLEINPPLRENAARPDTTRTLRYSYTRDGGEAWGLLRNLEGLNLQQATGIQLRVKAGTPAMLILNLKEHDDSEYQHLITLDAAGEWRTVDVPFTALQLGENSQDENQALDATQIKELSLLDISAVAGLPGGPTALEIDDVRFLLR